MSMKVQRKRELQNRDFIETQQICPRCGDILYGRIQELKVDSDDYDLVDMIEYECPRCGYRAKIYDV